MTMDGELATGDDTEAAGNMDGGVDSPERQVRVPRAHSLAQLLQDVVAEQPRLPTLRLDVRVRAEERLERPRLRHTATAQSTASPCATQRTQRSTRYKNAHIRNRQ